MNAGIQRKSIRLFLPLLLVLVIVASFIGMAVPVFADTTTAYNAGSGATGGGSGSSWSSVANITADDTNYASSSPSDNSSSEYLNATNYSFNIPAGATVNGIQVSIGRSASNSNSIRDNGVYLLKSTGQVGTDHSKTTSTYWPTSITAADYGATNDLWGTSWTVDEINASSFGVALRAYKNSTSDRTAYVDYVQITVTYTPHIPTTPTVTSISPGSGLLAGGTIVAITGTDFTGATAVKFGTADATTFTVNSATSITATSPAHDAGTVDITVTTPLGTSATSSADQFTYSLMAINGSGSASSTLASFTVSLTTTNPNDLLYVSVVNRTAVTSMTSSPSLTWTQRRVVNYNSSSSHLETWYALWPSSGTITITINENGNSYGTAAVAFGISGADTSSPFDAINSNSGSGTNASTTITTSNANDFIIGALAAESNPSLTVGSGFSPIRTQAVSNYRETSDEYKIVSSIQSGASVNYTLSSSQPWAIIADSVKAAVIKTDPTLSVTNSPRTYDGNPQAAAVDGSVDGTVSDIKYDGSSTAPTNAGTYAVTADFAPDDAINYNSLNDDSAGNFTIDKLSASVTPNANSKGYGTSDPDLNTNGGTLTGFVPADGVTATYSRTPGETIAGSPYTISATLSPVGVLDNYDITYNTADFVITPPGTWTGEYWYLDQGLTLVRPPETPSGTFDVPAGGTGTIWQSNVPAAEKVTFPPGTWTIFLKTDDWSDDCTAEIGTYSGGGFSAFATGAPDVSYADGILTIRITSGSIDVDAGNYLALRVKNDSDDAKTIQTDGSSFVVIPQSTPPWPVPELAAGILLALGLGGIGGFIVIKRKKALKNQ